MTYNPKTYWRERYRRHGPTYVARGGRPAEYLREQRGAQPYLRKYVTGKRVLDFGCGSGRFRDVLSEGGREYVGVDLNEDLATVQLVDDRLPRGFDTAVALWVLQHIVDEVEYLHWTRELYEALVPGGQLLVIDQFPDPTTHFDAHMKPRGIPALLRAAPWTGVETLGGYGDQHWIGKFNRPL